MSTEELIAQLRKEAEKFPSENLWYLMREAARRLEEYKNREEPKDANR